MTTCAKDSKRQYVRIKKLCSEAEILGHESVNIRLKRHQILLIVADLLSIAISVFLSFGVISNFSFPEAQRYNLMLMVVLAIPVRIGIFSVTNLYRRLWKYASVEDLVQICKSITIGSIVLIALVYVLRTVDFPRRVFLLDWMSMILLIGGSRFVIRFRSSLESVLRPRGSAAPVLIYGIGSTAELIVREVENNHREQYKIEGFIDNSGANVGMRIH